MKNGNELQKELERLTNKRLQLVNDLDHVRSEIDQTTDALSASLLDGGSVADKLTAEVVRLKSRQDAIVSAMRSADSQTEDIRQRLSAAAELEEMVRKNTLKNEVRLETIALVKNIYSMLDQSITTIGKAHAADVALSKDNMLVTEIMRSNDKLRRYVEYARMDLLDAAHIERRGNKTTGK